MEPENLIKTIVPFDHLQTILLLMKIVTVDAHPLGICEGDDTVTMMVIMPNALFVTNKVNSSPCLAVLVNPLHGHDAKTIIFQLIGIKHVWISLLLWVGRLLT